MTTKSPSKSATRRSASRRAGVHATGTSRNFIWIVSALAFFITGFDGLVFEVIWIRLLSGIFGTTIYATSTTIAAFLGGLGIGAFAIGKYADRRQLGFRELLRLFAICEVMAGTTALLLSVSLPRLQALGALLGHGDLTAGVVAGRAVMTLVLLFVPTFFMGGSLPVLSKALLMVSPRAGSTIGILYAVNTLGAALGAILVDAWLVIHLGIVRTAWVAALGNVGAAGLVSLFLTQSALGTGAPGRAPSPASSPPLLGGVHPKLFLAVYAVSGFCALGYEVVWARILLGEVYASRFAISTMLAVVLFGLVAGSALMALAIPRRMRIALVLAGVQLAIGLSAIAGLYLIELQSSALRLAADSWARQAIRFRPAGVNGIGIADCLPQVLALQALPAVFLGCVLPLVADGTVRGAGAAGRSVGLVYLWNTAGAIGGALATAFVILPRIGMEGTIQGLAALNLLLGIALASFRGRPWRRLLGGLGAIAVAIAFASLPKAGYIQRKEAKSLHQFSPDLRGRTLALREGLYETLAVREYSLLGVPVNQRLMTNFFSMSGVNMQSNRYMRLMAHIPLLLREEPRRAAVIAFGVGNTARAIAEHPVETIDVVDISPDILRLSSYFSTANHEVLADPRTEVHVNDGRNFLLGSDRRYDLVTFEPPPPDQSDVVGLYTKEYYELVRSRLTPEGLMTQWLPICITGNRTNLSAIKSALEVFPHVSLWTGALEELIICAGSEPIELHPEAVNRRIRVRGLAPALAEIGVDGGEALLATFLGGDREWLERMTASVPPVTDDNRLLEYDYARKWREPNRLSDYVDYFRSNDYAPGIDRRLQDDVRELCIWRLMQLRGELRDPGSLSKLLAMSGELHNRYLADAILGVAWPAQAVLDDPARQADILEDRRTLTKLVWHHLLRDELADAERWAQAGVERWPGDPQLEALKVLIRREATTH
jgi:predicted membrane-bound spermidine synthase